jgi:DnaJ-class molecular chaperone
MPNECETCGLPLWVCDCESMTETVPDNETCFRCGGSGGGEDDALQCRACNGTGSSRKYE